MNYTIVTPSELSSGRRCWKAQIHKDGRLVLSFGRFNSAVTARQAALDRAPEDIRRAVQECEHAMLAALASSGHRRPTAEQADVDGLGLFNAPRAPTML